VLDITERKVLRYLSYADTKDRGFSVTEITLYSGGVSNEEFFSKRRPTCAPPPIYIYIYI
jgi:negative regulator of genetic competence, sporulation and motility